MMRSIWLCFIYTTALALAITGKVSAISYAVTDLGTLGGDSSGAYNINNSGQVVGYAKTALGKTHAFVWDASLGMRDLGTLGGIDYSIASAINDDGEIVGTSFATSEQDSDTAVVWRADGSATPLGVGNRSAAHAINDEGQVVGVGETPNGQTYAFLWDSILGTRNLGTLGGSFAVARDINDHGQATGTAHESGAARSPGFLWGSDEGMQSIGIIGGQSSQGFAINEHMQVVGSTNVAYGSTEYRAFLWDSLQGMRLLGEMGDSSLAHDINETGQIVGYVRYLAPSLPSGCIDRACLWAAGVPVELNSLLPGSGWDFRYAYAINDSGQIAGSGIYNGQSRAFLLTPVPEPSSLLALSCGLGSLGVLARRKAINGHGS